MIPEHNQTVYMMTPLDVLRVLWKMQRTEGRNVGELKLYTTDDLRRLYHATDEPLIRLRDGIVTRIQLVAVIRYRVWRKQCRYVLLLMVSIIGAGAAVIAAAEGWHF